MILGINIYISLFRACLVTLVYSTVPWTYSSTILWMYRKKRRKKHFINYKIIGSLKSFQITRSLQRDTVTKCALHELNVEYNQNASHIYIVDFYQMPPFKNASFSAPTFLEHGAPPSTSPPPP